MNSNNSFVQFRIPADMLVPAVEQVYIVEWFGRDIDDSADEPEAWHVGGVFQSETSAQHDVANRWDTHREQARYQVWSVRR